MLSKLDIQDDELAFANTMQLITRKPVLYVCNVSESDVVSGNGYTKQVEEFAKSRNASTVIVSAAIESEIAMIQDENEKLEYIESLGLQESGLARVVRGGYGLLNLITFFTVGPQEAHAWTTHSGAKAPAAAGVIHSDFERGFICAETISYEDYVTYNGESGAKAAGKMRLEGKEYLVNDGDVFHFRFNV
jgi:ribosome-binding ATPase YchF (GTP1/OBG family)